MVHGKKGHPRKAQILSVNEHVLDKQVGIATMVQITTQIALLLGVDHVHVVRILEVITKRLTGLCVQTEKLDDCN